MSPNSESINFVLSFYKNTRVCGLSTMYSFRDMAIQNLHKKVKDHSKMCTFSLVTTTTLRLRGSCKIASKPLSLSCIKISQKISEVVLIDVLLI